MLVNTDVPMHRRAMSIDRCCALAGVSRRTLYNWVNAGKVEYVRTAGGAIRIFVDTLWRQEAADVVDREVQNARAGAVDAG